MAGEFLRGFSKFFTNLTAPQRQELERAFSDMQNSKEITSLDESIRLLKRKPDQTLPIPVLSFTYAARGAVVNWNALPDQRINFYEVNISNFSNFASFTTVPTFGTQIILQGLSATRYVRVRGVRRDGTTTPFSEAGVIVPQGFDITAHSEEAFYVKITGITAQTIVGGPGTSLEYTPINPDGNSMVWGFITCYADPSIGITGDTAIKASLMVTTTQADGDSTDEEIVRVSFGEYFNCLSIGPVIVEHPDLGGTISVRLDMTDSTKTQADAPRLQDATEVTWCHLNVFELGSS